MLIGLIFKIINVFRKGLQVLLHLNALFWDFVVRVRERDRLRKEYRGHLCVASNNTCVCLKELHTWPCIKDYVNCLG